MAKDTGFLLDIDALFDLRIGTLVTMSPDIGAELMGERSYYERESDTFSYKGSILETAKFKKLYEAVKYDVLRNSPKTKIDLLLVEMFNATTGAIAANQICRPVLDINYNGYDITEKEKEDISKSLAYLTNNIFNISFIDIDKKLITPKFLMSKYHTYVLYDLPSWENKTFQEIAKLQSLFLDFNIVIPRLTYNRILSTEEKELFTKNGTDCFSFLQILMRQYFNLQFVPPAYFSIDCPRNPLNKTDKS